MRGQRTAPARKRRRVTENIEELTFDPAARQEYLTGFHKRKLQRIKHAQEQAAKTEKEEKVQARKEMRQQRKEDLEKHVEEVNRILRETNPDSYEGEPGVGEDGEEAEWGGFDEPEKVDREDEYMDEDKYTTVTIETMDDLRNLRGSDDEEEEEAKGGHEDKEKDKVEEDGTTTKKKAWTKQNPNKKPKTKKPKFRYESKAERKQTRHKQKSKNAAAAKERREK